MLGKQQKGTNLVTVFSRAEETKSQLEDHKIQFAPNNSLSCPLSGLCVTGAVHIFLVARRNVDPQHGLQ